MSDELRIGVIGVGDFGEKHVKAYTRREDVAVVGVADTDHDLAQAVAARWNVPQWFGDGQSLISECQPDAVSIATTAQHHAEQAAMALGHGCFVLLEKPVAMSSSEVLRIEEAQRRSDACVQPAHILRFSAPHLAMCDRIRKGVVGELVGISAARHRSRDHERAFPGLHPVLMTMVHDIDLAFWMSGSRAIRVSAEQGSGRRPFAVWARVTAANGTVWSLDTSWVLPTEVGPPDRFEVFGTQGVISLAATPTVRVFAESTQAVDHELTPDAHPGALDAEIAHFCSCVRDKAPSTLITLGDAAHGIRVAEAIMFSLELDGAPVEVG